MSTRSTIVLVESQGADMHLYREMHDGLAHLAIEAHDDAHHSFVNVVVPEPLVEGVTLILRRAHLAVYPNAVVSD